VARRKKQRELEVAEERTPVENGTPVAHDPRVRRSSAALIAQLDRVDARRDHALEFVLHRGVRLERLVAEAEKRAAAPDLASLRLLADQLERLQPMIGDVRDTLARATDGPAGAIAGVAPPDDEAPAVASEAAEEAGPAGPTEPDAQANGGAPAAAEHAASEATVLEIAARLREHDAHSDEVRAVLAERLLLLEARACELAPGRDDCGERPGHLEPVKRPAPVKHPTPKPARGQTFRLTTPLMKSARIAAYQRLLNRRFAVWKVRLRIEVDGEYGPETREAVRQVMFGMGISTKELEGGVTPELRERIRHPERRTAAERARAHERREWIRRLRRRHDGHGPAAAIAYARKHIGVKEDPGRPNRGKQIDKWNTATGIPLNANAFWCGAFVNGCLIAAGFPPDRVLAYCPSIEDRAQQGREGWSWHSKPRPGDLALFTHRYPDSRMDAGHVGMVERVEGNAVVTIEGNTSPNTASNNGIGVFRRRRSLPIRGFARPPYKR
jgi:hypothetical protein